MATSWVERMRLRPAWAGDLLTIDARIDGITVGRATCSTGDGALQMCDLEVYDETKLDCRRFLPWYERMWTRRPISARGQRFGEKLLNSVLDHAHRARLSCVHGAIREGDLSAREWLLSFYERHGFVLLPPGPVENELPGAVYRIERRLHFVAPS